MAWAQLNTAYMHSFNHLHLYRRKFPEIHLLLRKEKAKDIVSLAVRSMYHAATFPFTDPPDKLRVVLCAHAIIDDGPCQPFAASVSASSRGHQRAPRSITIAETPALGIWESWVRLLRCEIWRNNSFERGTILDFQISDYTFLPLQPQILVTYLYTDFHWLFFFPGNVSDLILLQYVQCYELWELVKFGHFPNLN